MEEHLNGKKSEICEDIVGRDKEHEWNIGDVACFRTTAAFSDTQLFSARFMLCSTAAINIPFIIGYNGNFVSDCAPTLDRWFVIQRPVPSHVRSPVTGGSVKRL